MAVLWVQGMWAGGVLDARVGRGLRSAERRPQVGRLRGMF